MSFFEQSDGQLNPSLRQVSRIYKRLCTEETLNWLVRIVLVFLLLFFFLVGVKTLEGSFKFLGGDFAKTLFMVTSHPFISLMTGILATALFQSSSVTTSIIVGLVSAGTLSLDNAIPMIMGANLGTSVTNTLVSLGYMKNTVNFRKAFAAATIHDFFNVLTVAVLLPFELMTGFLSSVAQWLAHILYGTFMGISYHSPIKGAIRPFVDSIKTLITDATFLPKVFTGILMMIVACAIIVSSLGLIVRIMKVIVQSNRGKIVNHMLSKNAFLTILLGAALTISVQSSSITTSLLIPLAGSGLLSLSVIFRITIGANIGTTATALLASMTGNVYGLAIALVHFIFNILGALIWYAHPKMRQIPLWCARKLAYRISNRRYLSFAYILAIFFAFPLFLIYFTS